MREAHAELDQVFMMVLEGYIDLFQLVERSSTV